MWRNDNIMRKKKRISMNEISSRSVICALILNILVIVFCYLFFGWLLKYIGYVHLKNVYTDGFRYRELWLCLLFAFLVNGVIDFHLIIRPLWNLEELIQKYVNMTEENNWNPSLQIKKVDSIENELRKLIKHQKIMHEKEKIEEKQRQKAELYALQSQIDPHFLYNALDSIRGYALLHDMEQISDITEALSRVFRNMISDKNELLTLRQEMDNIYNYMKVQQFRFNNKFKFFCKVEDELLDNYKIPRMILQPLVENAIMHGLERRLDGGWVKVIAYITEKRLVLDVIDNGVGISEERLQLLNNAMKLAPGEYYVVNDYKHAGIALININKRIKLNFGSQFGIILSSTPNIRTVSEVILPLIINRN